MVALGSVRSCAVTTLALCLASTWPSRSDSSGRRVLLVEADPAGGTLAAVSGWAAEPSLVSLAAAARRGGEAALVWEHCQGLPGGEAALAAPGGAEQAAGALGMLAGLLGCLGGLDADVVVDCGRLDPASPALSLWERADRAVLAVRPRLADLAALATWLEGRPPGGDRLGLVVVGDGPYPDAEITDALGVEVLARLPWDPAAAAALATVPASARQLRLAPLVRAGRSLADRLAADLARLAAADGTSMTASAQTARRGVPPVRAGVLRGWARTRAASTNGSTAEEVTS